MDTTDEAPMKLNREIPIPWLIGGVITFIVQAVTLWISVQNQGQAIRDLVTEVRELRTDARSGGLKVVEHDLKLSDHERRIAQLEARKP